MLAVRCDVPVNIIFAFDGEEELGSMNFVGPFRQRFLDELKQADAAYYLNPSQNAKGDQVLYLGNRGIAFGELEIRGGEWGGLPSGPSSPRKTSGWTRRRGVSRRPWPR